MTDLKIINYYNNFWSSLSKMIKDFITKHIYSSSLGLILILVSIGGFILRKKQNYLIYPAYVNNQYPH